MERSTIQILLVEDFKPYRDFVTSLLGENPDLRIARRIGRLVPSPKVVFFTQETDIEVVKEALSLGAWGYIVKTHGGTDLLAGLQAILHGKRFVSSAVADNGFASTSLNPTD